VPGGKPASSSVRVDPQLVALDKRLAAGAPARRDGVGAADLIPAESSWPIQPEETALMPTRYACDPMKWKFDAGL
jgi:hypothetical protein